MLDIPDPSHGSADSPRIDAAVRRHLPLVWRVIRRVGLGPAQAEQAAMDVFWVFAQRMRDIRRDGEASFLAWTAVCIASDLRKAKPPRRVPKPVYVKHTDERRREAAALVREGLYLVDRALDHLDPADRAIFVLMELEEMSGKQVGKILGVPPSALTPRLEVARERFGDALGRLMRRSASLSSRA
jgi:RNA polymerase sigma-70 factor (ECF subfamily)